MQLGEMQLGEMQSGEMQSGEMQLSPNYYFNGVSEWGERVSNRT